MPAYTWRDKKSGARIEVDRASMSEYKVAPTEEEVRNAGLELDNPEWERLLSDFSVMVHAYRDGVKRPGFSEAKEAAKLTKQASNTAANSETRKEVAREIIKMGLKPGKDLV